MQRWRCGSCAGALLSECPQALPVPLVLGTLRWPSPGLPGLSTALVWVPSWWEVVWSLLLCLYSSFVSSAQVGSPFTTVQMASPSRASRSRMLARTP